MCTTSVAEKQEIHTKHLFENAGEEITLGIKMQTGGNIKTDIKRKNM
jgi:hypothetical protein